MYTIFMSDCSKKVKIENLNENKKHFPSSVREWNNSIYLYNKNALNLIPSTTVSAKKAIRSYFSFFNKSLERKIRTKGLMRRFRRISSNRIYISNGEFKHTNNKVLINIYLFNRQKYNYLRKLRKIYLNKILSRKKSNIKSKIIKRLKSVYIKGLDVLMKNNYNKYLLIKTLNMIENNSNYKINSFKSLSKSIAIFYRRLLKIHMKRLYIYFQYKQLLLINKSKLNYTYLQQLKLHLEKFYNKNVEFNLINLRNMYLNSDILSESVRLKLTRNRRRLFKVMNKIKQKVRIHIKQTYLRRLKISNKNLILNDMRYNNNKLKRIVINNLKYKDVTGFRLEAKGRLSRRYTASRSIFRKREKGNLLGIESSYRKLSTVMLRGNLKSNLQYTKSVSKARIGAFGLKGWVSGN